MLVLTTLAVIASPAAACTRLNAASVGGYPGPGVYAEDGCDSFNGDAGVDLGCQFVPLILVANQPVPGTDETYCTVDHTVPVDSGDRNIVLCDGSGACVAVGQRSIEYLCSDLNVSPLFCA